LAVLESAVAGAIAKLQDKLEYWGTGEECSGGTMWERPGALGEESLEELLNSIDTSNLVGKNEWAIVGVGWELLRGAKIPAEITRKRDELLEKFDAGEELTRIEELWLNLTLVDTD
jgi:hypothetical protein